MNVYPETIYTSDEREIAILAAMSFLAYNNVNNSLCGLFDHKPLSSDEVSEACKKFAWNFAENAKCDKHKTNHTVKLKGGFELSHWCPSCRFDEEEFRDNEKKKETADRTRKMRVKERVINRRQDADSIAFFRALAMAGTVKK